jgi:hypothetical protein
MTDPMDERRQFPRLSLEDEARVYNDGGEELGLVVQASGGGMRMKANSSLVATSLAIGQRLRIRIFEPRSGANTVIRVEVRHRDGANLGFEFAGS